MSFASKLAAFKRQKLSDDPAAAGDSSGGAGDARPPVYRAVAERAAPSAPWTLRGLWLHFRETGGLIELKIVEPPRSSDGGSGTSRGIVGFRTRRGLDYALAMLPTTGLRVWELPPGADSAAAVAPNEPTEQPAATATAGPPLGPQPAPFVVVGGVGGSGTRLVATCLQRLGVRIGPDLNESLDNLFFTLLFKVRPLKTNQSTTSLPRFFLRCACKKAPPQKLPTS
jgi:hypothetical protein